ncbi:hypothetical protein TNIN_353331 [Trichonephila inaurata madagascariensis]|uniref:Uncharacterized protein n=1 Tax=Trichonephila inaurata madagascariensis TaxID=2747483 RepID=A0A8X6X4R0_9ARAC|nr:hypothetical protein TNIN_353331 [Trichonephila inaurata madagascariensis]
METLSSRTRHSGTPYPDQSAQTTTPFLHSPHLVLAFPIDPGRALINLQRDVFPGKPLPLSKRFSLKGFREKTSK